jgi:hypothetical protein
MDQLCHHAAKVFGLPDCSGLMHILGLHRTRTPMVKFHYDGIFTAIDRIWSAFSELSGHPIEHRTPVASSREEQKAYW